LEGTVGATISAIDRHFYGEVSDIVTHGAPMDVAEQPAQSPPSQLRAKDLIAELHSINAQIHRIMFQVERAVAHLATSR
jgi:hypothetical protein